MIGIDLNDLSDPLLKERDENALRLITHPEDDFLNLPDFFWYLWTAKESVFKAKRDLASFSPKEIPISFNQNSTEKVSFKSGKYAGVVTRDQQLIYSVASHESTSPLYQVFERATNDESKEVRDSLIHYLQKNLNIESEIIRDGNGLPILSHQEIPVSFTHHHRFLGFAIPNFI
ncbi:4'-phosphopantetheinyl transferase family protein [Marinoscillum furvescens]|uniref:4'-phosphopantetheinyl transferase superfamily protein n=1 Tax=Marinoscillum furvescens DSM 4134 TaxID=1122208 RepID=A0A3D9L268_MARFU|nr:4'-phosphopantetheinyl transferase superfamily protein [Marinoscillum furvescens]RED98012.1 4'-phosphopantetheinyl transferase superfamily protein [Marinoscillum furvescens DSM 4134]